MPVKKFPAEKTRRFVAPLGLAAAIALFFAGVSFPFFNVQKFWVFQDKVSVLSGLVNLAQADEWFLFVIIFLFTIIFPIVKLAGLATVWWARGRDDERADQTLRWVSHLGKWSMLDVFVVAILVVTLKSASVAKMTLGVGIYLFTASVILTQLIAMRLERRLGQSTPS